MKLMNLLNKMICAAALALAAWGCSSQNSDAPSVNATGQHPPLSAWHVDHRASFTSHPLQCTECHGTNLQGGISGVNCFSGVSGIPGFPCHSNGHPPRVAAHAIPFKTPTLHGPAAKADLSFCQACHGTTGGPGSNPRFNVVIGSLTNGCEDCHADRTAHPPVDPARLPGFPANWLGHAGALNMANDCILCHGASLRGPLEGGVGPACNSCHTNLQAGLIPPPGTCISCHGKPPTTGSHSIHNAQTAVKDICDTCHNAAGRGTTKHSNGTVDVAFLTKYNANSGTATINQDKSCANVSCHGGVTTPVWGGTINVASDCASCHVRGTGVQSPQFNSYFSGQHTLHINQIGLQCTDCHDMNQTNGGASHFSGLATPAFELAPRFTIRVPGYATTPGSCNPRSNLSVNYSISNVICHGALSWQ